MKLFSFMQQNSRVITQFNSQGATAVPLALGITQGQCVVIQLEPGGVLGRHAAASQQLFCVIEGSGQVSGADAIWHDITAGQTALWQEKELHETQAGPHGLVAFIVEGDFHTST